MLYFLSASIFKFQIQRRELCLKNLKNLATLAWALHSECCARILQSLKNLLNSKEFSDRHKTSPEAFTRNRKLPFPLLVCLLANLFRSSYQNELDQFFKALGRFPVARRVVTKAALTLARKKLKYGAFVELNRHLLQKADEFLCFKRWHGFRLLAIDGTTCRLPSIDKISEHFGTWKVRQGAPSPAARVSEIFDVLNKVTIGAVISPIKQDEREHAHELFLSLLPGDLVLMDRGYPAFWVFKAILTMKAEFCARIDKRWSVVKEFLKSGLPEQLICLEPSAYSGKACKEHGMCEKPTTVRLVRVELDSGETEVLVTSLLDTERFKHREFKMLYHFRWFIEEDYKTLKCWQELENFTGKTVHSIYQDFHAKIFSANLTSILCFPIRSRLEAQEIRGKHRHQINFAQALSKMKYVIPLLFQRAFGSVKRIASELLEIIFITTEPVRPGRKFPRNKKASVRRYFLNYKPIS